MSELGREMMKMTFDVMRQSAGLVQSLLPSEDSRVSWQEFQNKLEAFTSFAYADTQLGELADAGLREAVHAAAALGPYASVWSMEGLGHREAERLWKRRPSTYGIISHGLPARSLIPLHAGMGLSFACRSLESGGDVRDRLARFFDLCEVNSLDGYFGAAYEALGLIARNLYPEWVRAIDRALEFDTELLSYFWHGVGRGIYFVPTNFPTLASAPWRSISMARQEPPHELASLNALSGLIWAFTLVNIRHPQLLGALVEHHGEELLRNEGYWNGLGSALMVWRMTSPDDPSPDVFGPPDRSRDASRPGELFRFMEAWHAIAAH